MLSCAGALAASPSSFLPLRAPYLFRQLGARLGRRLQQPQQHRVHALRNLIVVASLVTHAGENNMPRRLPKPSDQPPNPRHRGTRGSGLKAALDARSQLASAVLSPDDMTQYANEVIASPRSAAIILAAHVEDSLHLALARRLRIKPSSWREVFSTERGPLGTFANKISMADAIGLISSETRRNLDIIRHLRNAFAHAMRPISFDTKEVADLCAMLRPPSPLPPTTGTHADAENPTPRQRYQHTCELIMHNLFVAAGFYYPINQLPPPETV